MCFGPRDLLRGAGVSQLPASGSLLYETFWTVWERSSLLSTAVKQLVKLLVHVLLWEKEVEVNAVNLGRTTVSPAPLLTFFFGSFQSAN